MLIIKDNYLIFSDMNWDWNKLATRWRSTCHLGWSVPAKPAVHRTITRIMYLVYQVTRVPLNLLASLSSQRPSWNPKEPPCCSSHYVMFINIWNFQLLSLKTDGLHQTGKEILLVFSPLQPVYVKKILNSN